MIQVTKKQYLRPHQNALLRRFQMYPCIHFCLYTSSISFSPLFSSASYDHLGVSLVQCIPDQQKLRERRCRAVLRPTPRCVNQGMLFEPLPHLGFVVTSSFAACFLFSSYLYQSTYRLQNHCYPGAPASQAEPQWRIELDTQLETHCELLIFDAVLDPFWMLFCAVDSDLMSNRK